MNHCQVTSDLTAWENDYRDPDEYETDLDLESLEDHQPIQVMTLEQWEDNQNAG